MVAETFWRRLANKFGVFWSSLCVVHMKLESWVLCWNFCAQKATKSHTLFLSFTFSVWNIVSFTLGNLAHLFTRKPHLVKEDVVQKGTQKASIHKNWWRSTEMWREKGRWKANGSCRSEIMRKRSGGEREEWLS